MALALSGGGAKGAYEVGALWEMVNQGEDVQYDVISGVSVGAINALGLAMFEKGKEKEAVDYLRSRFENITASNLWKWFPGLEMFRGNGLIDNAPLK